MQPLLALSAFLENYPALAAFLISVAALCILTTVLAILMLIADATINYYGRVVLTINDDKKIELDGGRTLLNSLKEEEIFIPSACGGKGTCGLCKCKVLSGAGEALPTETPWLTARELSEGYRLSCQVKVKQDISLEIPPELFEIRQYETEVASMKNLTHDIKELQLRLLDPPEMEFKAGQFIQIEVPAYRGSPEPVYRAYSISSDPINKDMIELEIRLIEDGICTTYVHQHLREGEKLMINGPHGDFGMRDGEGEIICVAGGSGMAPIKSILLTLSREECKRPIRYFFGARARRDLFMVEELRALEKELHDFTFIPVLSRPEPDDAWEGEVGLVTEVIERQLENSEDKQAYLCGSPFMIDACLKVLTSKGMPMSQIFYDKF